MEPEDQARFKELPKLLRSALGCDQKGRSPDMFLPMLLQIEYDKVLVTRVNGCSFLTQVSEILSSGSIVAGMKSLIIKYNARVARSNAVVDKKNAKVLAAFQSGAIDAASALEQHEVRLQLAMGKPSRMWASRWKQLFKWVERSFSAPSHYLPYKHAKMDAYRRYFKFKVTT